VGTSLNSIGC